MIDPASTLAHMTQLIMPQHANSLGITFGGQARTAAGLKHQSHQHLLCAPHIGSKQAPQMAVVHNGMHQMSTA